MEGKALVLTCSRCGQPNPSGSETCWRCRSSLAGITPSPAPVADLSETIGQTDSNWTAPVASDSGHEVRFEPGNVIAGRYEILSLLGQGGMGSVYKARDRELDRLVALKTIRADLASNEEILQRFKQEIILARKITHRNVIRIYDLGSAGNTKFITMDFIEGQELSDMMASRRLSFRESASIARQICLALECAHAEGVIHRDLKPQNVMVDKQGRAIVMDFGLARAVGLQGMTQTASFLGTPLYMSPEQAGGETLDARSDIYAFGIIFYEMLTGTVPFLTETMMATLVKRIQEAPPPPITVDPTVPGELNDIVVCATALKRDDRYASVTEIIADLNAWEAANSSADPSAIAATIAATRVAGMRTPASIAAEERARKSSRRRMAFALGGGALAAVGGVGWLFRDRISPAPRNNGKPITTLIADFENRTGDPIFDGTLEPLVAVALEGASFIHSFNRGQAKQIAAQIKPGAESKLNAENAQLVAVREGLNVVVSGYLRKDGSEYLLTARAMDAVKGTPIAISEASASSREAVLTSVSKLAAPIRRALGDTVPESVQLAAAETLSSASLPAVKAYSQGQDAQLLGKTDDAIRYYSEAIRLDPNFGRAYSGLGVIYRNLRQPEESDKYFKLALRHIGTMSDREKYRTRGAYYVMIGDHAKARDEYTRLVSQYPADSAGHANLAIALLHLRDLPKAIEEGRKAIEIYPRNASQRLNLALFQLYAGNLDAARAEAQKALELNPRYEPAILVLALSDAASGALDNAATTFDRLSQVSPRGASMASIGRADLALYEGRANDALAELAKGIAADLAAKNLLGAGRKRIAQAYTYLMRGQSSKAVESAAAASADSKDFGTLFGAGMVFVSAGEFTRASSIASQLKSHLEVEPQSYGYLLEGAMLNAQGKGSAAVQTLREAQKLVDTWTGRFLLGQAYLQAKAYTEADSEFDLCSKRRGEVIDIFFDYVPTCRYLPLLDYYQGLVHEALGSATARQYFESFLKTRAKGESDSLVTDAKRRLTKLGA